MKKAPRHPLVLWTALLSLAAVTLYGCKDFLTRASEPQGTLNEQSLATRGGVEGSLIAAYRALDWNFGVGGAWGNAASNWVWGSVTSDDAYKGSEASDQPAINDIEAYHWSTADSESYLNDKWRGTYEGVVRANATLRLLRQVVQDKPGEIPDADAAGIEGEALFLRAHFHSEAWRMWGNIPYYREDDTDFRKANSSSAEVVTELLQDLDAAIALLPASPRNGQPGRATRWTAKAYKGRLQVYAGAFADALTTLREVESGGPYELEESFDHVWSGFSEFSNGPETILAYQASVNDGEPAAANSNWGERLNFPHSGSPFGCCGFHQPSQNLVNFFAVDAAAGLPLALTDANWNARDANFTASTPVLVDPRLDWTVGRDGVPFKDWGMHEAGWIRSPAYGGPYSAKKNVHEKASGAESTVGWVPTQTNSVNIHIFRYADLLLLLAEAEVEAGTLENARTIVNQIRTRAGVRAQGCGVPTDAALAAAAAALVARYPACAGDTRVAVPINDPSIGWAAYRIGLYTTQFASQAFARDAVRYERRLELAMEGQRFFDLRRTNTHQQVINDYLAVESRRRPYLTAAEQLAPRHTLFPIPAIQIELSKVGGQPSLQQNTGW
ncbi:MAG: RagB/SusD family nutrient uptake outer membrane protein [Gemmatimonadota bacterium]|nr:RagB/SusD family nutrient uptake outer membrane protein [Gemmatimonadota bacterium]